MGGTYGVGVSGDISRLPVARYETSLQFDCAPDNVDRMIAAVKEELRAVKERGFSAEDLEKVKAAQRRSLEVARRTNGYWTDQLQWHYWNGFDPRSILEEARLIGALTGEDLKRAVGRYFDETRQLVGILRPAEGAPLTTAAPAPAR
jgi:zinc protease